MPNISISHGDQLVRISVCINGNPLSDAHNMISATVSCEAGKPGSAQLTLLDGDPSSGAFTLSSGNDLEPGNQITIFAGYSSAGEEIFNGKIKSQTLNAGRNGYPEVSVIATAPVIVRPLANNARFSVRYGATMLNFKATVSKVAKRLTIFGEVSLQGGAVLMPGDVIELKGVGNRYSGDAQIASVNHEIAEGNWITTVAFKK